MCRMKTKLTIAVLTMLASFSGSAQVRTESLDGQWSLDYWEQGKHPVMNPSEMKDIEYKTIPASVPGNVELDMFAAGLCPNPETGSNVHEMRKYEAYQWRYSREFTSPARRDADDVVLNFKGLDCYAEIFVNGKHAGSADNMLISQEYDVTDLINPEGESNRLEVIIRSCIAEEMKYLPPMPSYNWGYKESIHTRRAPHSYGWDIMPRLISAGLWKGVELKIVPPIRLGDIHWFTKFVNPEEKTAEIDVDYVTMAPVKEYNNNMKVRLTLSRDGEVKAEQIIPLVKFASRAHIRIGDAELWWPRGYGEPALYEARVCIEDKDGNVLDEDTKMVGLRTVSLDRSDTNTKENPGKFQFYVNGIPVFFHGSNWTPMDALHSRDPQHLEKTFALVTDLNCNMLRCWGGNVYEDDAFYELCDRNGVMIWQDFSMGCSFYPQDEEFRSVIGKEVRSVVKRLRSHPCIALWSGNNEDDEAILGWTDPNREALTRVLIPNILLEMDLTRPYLPSSPYYNSGFIEKYGTNVNYLPERHLWGPRGYYKDPFYSEAICQFASETGYHGMPCRESLEKMFPKESVYPWTDRKNFVWKEDWLTKSVREFGELGYTPDRNNLMINQVRLVFGDVPSDLDKFIFASQSVQGEAMKYFVERFRGNKFCPHTGILWWNIRDGWPIISDAVVDYYFSRKPAYYYIRNAQRNVCAIMLDAIDGHHPLVVTNDTRKACKGEIEVVDVESGKTVCKCVYNVEANGRSEAANIPETDGQGMYLIRYTGENGEQFTNHYLYGRPPFRLESYRKWIGGISM